MTMASLAGKIDIQEISLIAADASTIDLRSFLVELNLYEDIFAGGLYGNIVVSDSLGLINKLQLIGEEYITLKLETPSFNDPIWKTFRISSISDRLFTRDTTTESYVLHFVSPEVFLDHYYVVQRAFEGKPADIVEEIYTNYIQHPRRLIAKDDVITDSEDNTTLRIFTEPEEKIKFVSPSWTPLKCLSWVASKMKSTAKPLGGANYVFFETNKQYYWGSIEDIIKEQRDAGKIIGVYVYSPANVKVDSENIKDYVKNGNTVYKSPDIARDYLSIHELNVIKNVDALRNLQSGYTASVYHELDLATREYKEHKYDHIVEYGESQHMQTNAKGFFAVETVRSPYAHQFVGFKHKELFLDFKDENLNEKAFGIVPYRNSQFLDLEQIKLKIDVHGRTDVELGSMLYLYYPKSGPKSEKDKNKSIRDGYYSGLYFITAIHHRITLEHHAMTMEIVKDAYGDVDDGDGGS